MKYDIVVVGGGPAGLTAAIYARRAGKSVMMLEKSLVGGRIVNAKEIENYPGFISISGSDYAMKLFEQATNLGAEIGFEEVTQVRPGKPNVVVTADAEYEAGAVILATGAKNKALGITHEAEWIGNGVSYCATCDGMFYKGKDVVLAGGGRTTLEDAAYLAEVCRHVYWVDLRKEIKDEGGLLAPLLAKDNVELIKGAKVVSIDGDNALSTVTFENMATKEQRQVEASGLFIAIGHVPDNVAFANVATLADGGYIQAQEDTRIHENGIFAAGDCRVKKVRQLTTAVSDGTVAALAAVDYLNALEAN